MHSSVNILTYYTSILQRQVTLYYLYYTASKHQCPMTSPNMHNKKGKTKPEATAICFAALHTGLETTTSLHCIFLTIPLEILYIVSLYILSPTPFSYRF